MSFLEPSAACQVNCHENISKLPNSSVQNELSEKSGRADQTLFLPGLRDISGPEKCHQKPEMKKTSYIHYIVFC